MPRDGSGNYTLPVGNPVVSNTVIASSWANDTMSDIATQLNNVLTRDGVLGPTLPFKLVDGNVNAPGLGFNSEPGLGLYRINTSILGFAAAGKQTMVNDASTAGAVITSLYPRSAGQAEIRLNQDIYGTADTTVLRIYQASAGGIIQSLAVGAGTVKPILYTASAHSFTGPVIAEPNALSSRFISDIALNVASIGSYDYTTADALRFRLQYGAAAGETGNAGNFSIYRYQNDGVTSENAFNIDRATGVGVMQRQLQVGTADAPGTTSLVATRDVQIGGALAVTGSGGINASGGPISALTSISSATANIASIIELGPRTGTAGAAVIDFHGGHPSNDFDVRIALDGTVSTSRLDVAALSGALTFHYSGNTSGIQFENISGSAGNNVIAFGWTGAALGVRIDGTQVGTLTPSDRRLKKDIRPLGYGLSKLLELRPVEFEYDQSKSPIGFPKGLQYGFLTDELPSEIVSEWTMDLEDPENTTYEQYDPKLIIPILVKAVQELYARTQIH